MIRHDDAMLPCHAAPLLMFRRFDADAMPPAAFFMPRFYAPRAISPIFLLHITPCFDAAAATANAMRIRCDAIRRLRLMLLLCWRA